MENRKSKCSGYGMFTGVCWVIGLGIILSVAIGLPLKKSLGDNSSALAALVATGIGFAYVVLSAAEWLAQTRALKSNPLPDELDLSERSVAAERCKALTGCSTLHRHIRRLLTAWAAGASGPQVSSMAGNQMLRTMGVLAAETVAVLILLGSGAAFGAPQVLLTLGTGCMVLVTLMAIARFQLASQLAGYIESNLLARIGNDTPAAAGLEFTQVLGKAVTDSTASLATAQAKFAEQLAKVQADAAAQAAKAQTDAAAQIAKAQTDTAAQLTKAHSDAAAQIASAQQEAAAQAVKAQGETSAKLAAAQQETAAQLAKAQDKVAEQLGRVTEIATSVDNILKLQQTVDGTIKGVTATEEFKSTLLELKRHLSESDEMLKNLAKPRSIRLVEQDRE
ncbi:MAG: hypothetical protein WAQ74_06055 [Kiritimatiellia bacterium]|jgi:hypothetical protein|nr:hypothetical protein [Lentisphaerota bacterium]